MRCCWRGLSPALLATPGRVNSSRSCSCQLSNSINKKVDGPHRGCTYGPNGLCRLSQGLSNYENNLHKQCGIVKQHKFRHFRKQKATCKLRAASYLSFFVQFRFVLVFYHQGQFQFFVKLFQLAKCHIVQVKTDKGGNPVLAHVGEQVQDALATPAGHVCR